MVKGVEAYVRSLTELRSEFRGRIMMAIQKVVDFEISALEEAIDNPGFDKWLDQFYPVEHNLKSGERFIEYATRHMGPVIQEYMRRVQWPAVTLLGEEASVDMDDFIETYIRDYALRHGSSSRRQTLEVMEEARLKAEAKSLRAEIDRLTTKEAAAIRWREWAYGRAGTEADDEVVREGNAASREAWRQSGVTKLKWRTVGKSCPFCNKLNGKIVGIDRPFLEDGEVISVKTIKPVKYDETVPGVSGDIPLCDESSYIQEEIRARKACLTRQNVARIKRALKSHKPATKRVQRIGNKNELRLVSMLKNGKHIEDNEPFDALVGTFKKPKHLIEIKSIVRGKNDKITMHPESLARKIKEAKRFPRAKVHTIVFDERYGELLYRAGLGSFRLSAMEKVTRARLRRILQ